MKGLLVIRKYKNRRLYDTERSRHVTREELLDLIRSGRDIQIQEVGTGEDVTSETILAHLLQEAGLVARLLPPEFVMFLVRADQGRLAQFFRELLPAAVQQFQAAMRQAARPMEGMMSMAAVNPFFPGWLAGLPSPVAPAATPARPEGGASDLREKVDRLERELARMMATRTDARRPGSGRGSASGSPASPGAPRRRSARRERPPG
jgi:polyhydroxyalkanoate synthesis repressor PhaR